MSSSLASSKDNQWHSSRHHLIYHCEVMDLNIVHIFQSTEVVITNGQIISYLFSQLELLLNPLSTTLNNHWGDSFLSHTKRPFRLILHISYSGYFLCTFLWARYLFMEDVSRDYKLGILVFFRSILKFYCYILLNIYYINFGQEKMLKLKRVFKCSLTIYQDSRD